MGWGGRRRGDICGDEEEGLIFFLFRPAIQISVPGCLAGRIGDRSEGKCFMCEVVSASSVREVYCTCRYRCMSIVMISTWLATLGHSCTVQRDTRKCSCYTPL